MFDEKGYSGTEDFRYKIFEEEYESNINSKKKVIRKRKVLIYWSRDDAKYAKRKRAEKVLKAEKNLSNNVYSIDHSKQEYVVTQCLCKNTGEIADQTMQKINHDKISEEKFDGYFCIITSELNYDYKKILDVYHHLWRIEESFIITKSDLETRPIFVKTDKHIEAHLLVCYVSIMVLRLIQMKIAKDEVTVNRIKEVLTTCNCKVFPYGKVMFSSVSGRYDYMDKVDKFQNTYKGLKLNKEEDIIRNDFLMLSKLYKTDLDYLVLDINELNQRLKKMKFEIKKHK